MSIRSTKLVAVAGLVLLGGCEMNRPWVKDPNASPESQISAACTSEALRTEADSRSSNVAVLYGRVEYNNCMRAHGYIQQ